ncbi:DNA polymerase III subunit alpha [Streptomyces qinzhouensis]|uniref:DNA-directed DNA polymerase n=1 Tax=Streptomyces qinzhouensis TaxID=2599401 RepID=A0A5B8JL69_9ACTN|nr:DNA polymerase III subunit alpha [Streptomyces qinzhouensis]QDY78243.1 DNA polymerase III subunit alpha [Streptomyces qinzhouensis]
MSFTHLRTASGYSLRYGASHVPDLAGRAAERGLDALALTDRDSLAGAVRHAKACAAAGVRPLFGVDLGVPAVPRPGASGDGDPHRSRTPAKGGIFVAEPPQRAVFLARSAPGWAALCRLVSASAGSTAGSVLGSTAGSVLGSTSGSALGSMAGSTLGSTVGSTAGSALGSAVGDPGAAGPWSTGPAAAAWAALDHAAAGPAPDGLFVLLGADSEPGRALARGRPDLAARLVGPWRERFGDALRIEVACHDRPGSGPGSLRLAARLLGFATEQGITPVLTNAVRYADPGQGEIADILDSARLLVPVDARDGSALDGGERWLKDTGDMERIAERVAEAAGGAQAVRRARELLAATEETAAACVVDPGDAFGLGRLHLPEPHLIGATRGSADRELAARCAGAMMHRGHHRDPGRWDRLEGELRIIAGLGLAGYFLTMAEIVRLVKDMGVRIAARGSGVGSLVVHLLGMSPVDPVEHGLVMERFLSPYRTAMPDIDLDVESARRVEVYQAVLKRFGSERVATLAVYETYRARGAIEAVARARGIEPDEARRLAKAFPQIRAKDVRASLRELPELREVAGEDHGRLWSLVEALDGLPHGTAMHPCGLLISDDGLLDRTPTVPTTLDGIAMSQFDKEDVEDTGHIKADLIGVRMQSTLAHAVAEIERATGEHLDIDDPAQVPLDDPATYELIRSAQTMGCFQIESPGQRDLVRRLRPRTIDDITLDISLFRPGPVAANMIDPLIAVRDGRAGPGCPHEDLREILAETGGQVVFHEQVILIMTKMTGCDLGQADEARRALSDRDRQGRLRAWFADRARQRGYPAQVVRDVWKILEGFGAYGFCKGHGAAFARPTYQSAWLKTHRAAAFYAGLLTHDPGMYHKRVFVADARRRGVPVLLPEVNKSHADTRIELVSGGKSEKWGVRLGLAQVRGISEAETARIVAGRPYVSLTDFWRRAHPSRPVAERLARVGALDALGTGDRTGRRELLLEIAELHRQGRTALDPGQLPLTAPDGPSPAAVPDPSPDSGRTGGLPAMDDGDQLAAELDVLDMDITRHLLDDHRALLTDIGATPAARLGELPHGTTVLVAGVKTATQTPPIRGGRRVVFATLDDPTGLSDLAFFEDSHDRCAATVFHSALLLVRGTVCRPRNRPGSLSVTGEAAWDLAELIELHRDGGAAAVADRLTRKQPDTAGTDRRRSRTLTEPTGYVMNAWADLRPPGVPLVGGRTLHHASRGSAG